MEKKLQHFNDEMRRAHRHSLLLAFTTAASPKEFFGFDHLAVATIHYHHRDLGNGMWFRLRDGRVVCEMALPADQDMRMYNAGRCHAAC